MKELNPIDETEYRMECRKLIQELGIESCYQVLYELIRCSEILTEEMLREAKKGMESE